MNSSTPATPRLAIVLSHPTQYYSPWFRWLTANTNLALRVFYLWDFGITHQRDPGFTTAFKWDVDLLSGYAWELVPNRSKAPGTEMFRGLDNPTLPGRLAAWRPTAVMVFGYKYVSHLRVLAWARRRRVPLIFRGDSHALGRGAPAGVRGWLLRALYGQFAALTYVGAANREYFRGLGVPEERLFFAPHAVDQSLFDPARPEVAEQAEKLRADLGISPRAPVVLFAGKLTPAKQPLALLQAFLSVASADASLVYVGDGPEKSALLEAARHARPGAVHFLPFTNQSQMPARYALADLFVLPSRGVYETWGLAVNEAMHMGVPCIVSDRVGCQRDLVVDCESGWVFRHDDVAHLAHALTQGLEAVRRDRSGWARRASQKVSGYSYAAAAAGLSRAVASVAQPATARIRDVLSLDGRCRVRRGRCVGAAHTRSSSSLPQLTARPAITPLRISIVMGFFLPVPPVAGGATEKSWHRLALEFARRGHEVTVLSRRWNGWPADEVRDGVRHLRLPGFDHTPHLARNLVRDARWSIRVRGKLPPADVTIVNSVSLPAFPRWRRNVAGRLVVMTGRIPKGQFRFYRTVDRVLAVSTAVLQRIQVENPDAAARAVVTGYPIDCDGLARARPVRRDSVTVGYVGRLHREKGLHLLADAARHLAAARDLPPWRIVLCGPVDVARGGSGADYVRALRQSFQDIPGGPAVEFRDARFDDNALADTYREIDVFCYPSLAAQGETFGVAVAEAMAAGAVPVVSSLPCFRDYLQPGVNGETFDETAPDAAARLAKALAALLRDPARRDRMAAAAAASIRRFDVRAYADRLLADFSTLN